MLALAVYGVITFNYGKFGSEIAYGAVITFWLLSHIVNLTFACLYYLGRPAYRQSERFTMTNDITVADATETYHFVTHDISETGLSLLLTVLTTLIRMKILPLLSAKKMK